VRGKNCSGAAPWRILRFARWRKRRERDVPYIIKWIAAGSSQTVEHPMSYDDLSEALDHGCTVLDQEPADLWIENEEGLCVAEIPRILEHCAKRRLQPR
jgi:hypothetical protein